MRVLDEFSPAKVASAFAALQSDKAPRGDRVDVKLRPIMAAPAPVFAIVGWREGADVEILGTGVLIGPKHVLTAGHVVQRRPPEEAPDSRQLTTDELDRQRRRYLRRYRVYSPWAGIKTLVAIDHRPKGRATRAVPGAGIAILELQSPIPAQLAPLALAPQRPDPDNTLDAFGFGGDYSGLLQVVCCRLAPPCGHGGICINLSTRLGPRDSGAPLLVKVDKLYQLAGIYAGVRRIANSPGFERFAIAVDDYRTILSEFSSSQQPGSSGTTGKVEMKPNGLVSDDRFEPPAYTLGIDKKNEHRFVVSNVAGRAVLTFAVNATSLPLRSRPRMTVLLYRIEGERETLVGRRSYPGPLQTFRIVGGESRRESAAETPRTNAGEWKILVSSETEITYQVTATLYDG